MIDAVNNENNFLFYTSMQHTSERKQQIKSVKSNTFLLNTTKHKYIVFIVL